jgi:tetratricopeptide (TPR) repeat protein
LRFGELQLADRGRHEHERPQRVRSGVLNRVDLVNRIIPVETREGALVFALNRGAQRAHHRGRAQLGELPLLDAARVTQQRALAIKEAVYGPEHPEVARTLTNLGSVQQQLGEFEAARVTQQRALAIQEAVYGPEHPDVSITLTNLGIVQQQLGKLDAAREDVERALAIFEQFLGLNHPTTRQARAHLASLGADDETSQDAPAPEPSSRRWPRLRRG